MILSITLAFPTHGCHGFWCHVFHSRIFIHPYCLQYTRCNIINSIRTMTLWI